MNVLVKVTGSLIEDEKFYNWISSIADRGDNLFVLIGGGEAITKVLEKKAVHYKFGPQGREIGSEAGKKWAREVLDIEKFFVEGEFIERKICAKVFMPFKEIDGEIFHMNGDSYALALYPSFDKIYIVTLKGRKKSFSKDLNKLEIIYL
jgi:hypothetical protein